MQRFNKSRPSFVLDSDFVISAPSFLLAGVVQFRVEPRLGKFPVTPHRYPRNLEHFRHLVIVEPAKVF